jgi:hypothetical protein
MLSFKMITASIFIIPENLSRSKKHRKISLVQDGLLKASARDAPHPI